jgi:hypothetical protein
MVHGRRLRDGVAYHWRARVHDTLSPDAAWASLHDPAGVALHVYLARPAAPALALVTPSQPGGSVAPRHLILLDQRYADTLREAGAKMARVDFWLGCHPQWDDMILGQYERVLDTLAQAGIGALDPHWTRKPAFAAFQRIAAPR